MECNQTISEHSSSLTTATAKSTVKATANANATETATATATATAKTVKTTKKTKVSKKSVSTSTTTSSSTINNSKLSETETTLADLNLLETTTKLNDCIGKQIKMQKIDIASEKVGGNTSSSSSSNSNKNSISPNKEATPIDDGLNNDTNIIVDNGKNSPIADNNQKAIITLKKKSNSTVGSGGKKKSKKSKKSEAEKENISVKKNYLENQQKPNNRKTKPPSNHNVKISRCVSVKNLCRSFGDLTMINDSKLDSQNINNLKRAQSVGDIRKFELTKHFEFFGVSVRALRDSYCCLVGLVSSNTCGGKSFTSFKKKSSFSKFDALQKKNLLHVRSSDAGKAQEKFSEMEKDKFCNACKKAVYKMEELKAEGLVWHKNCFRCAECSKQLSVDNYMKNISLYCKVHYKLLFGPKVADSTIDKPTKPELIIRENQPEELPPDVVRASDKPDLGLEELQQLNVRSRFQVFEKPQEEKPIENIDRSTNNVKRSASIMSKLAKFQAKGMNTGVSDSDLHGIPLDNSSTESLSEDDEEFAETDDPDLIRAKRAQKERPMSFNNMNDIKTKFENGNIMSREGRREERKQEIQNIRSRLFMGKQARIKEMYQAAVAESENGKTSTGKKPEIDVKDKARSIKEKFETGAIFKDSDDEATTSGRVAFSQDEEMGVFESGISKKSRSIFMEMDASTCKNNQLPSTGPTSQRTPEIKNRQPFPPVQAESIVKCDEKTDDIKIETSEIVSKFKFFETYKPSEQKKKVFRITPPRDGVVKMPTNEDEPNEEQENEKDCAEDESIALVKSHTTTKMLSMFREMEQNKRQPNEAGLKPLKRFTPPPDEQRIYTAEESDMESLTDGEEECDEEDDEEEIEEDDEGEGKSARYEDEFLNQAQSAARAKLLREKFEKWEANEIRRELINGNSNGTINIYTDDVEENQIESTKSLRAKFENMKESEKGPTRPKYQINRFV